MSGSVSSVRGNIGRSAHAGHSRTCKRTGEEAFWLHRMSKLLPNVFIPFLESLTFSRPKEDARPICSLWDDRHGAKPGGGAIVKSGVFLYQRDQTELSLAGVRQKLFHLLRNARHVATEPIVDAIVACAVGASGSGTERAEFLESVLSRFRVAEVSHFFVHPFRALMQPIQFDGYRLGELDLAILKSRCGRAKSDYAELYGASLKGRLALQSPEFKHVVIDFLKPAKEKGLIFSDSWRDLLLNYFERVSRQHLEFMWEHLNRTQVLLAPFGAHILDIENFRRKGVGSFAESVTIYLTFSLIDAGYVVPERGSVTINQPGPDSEFYSRFKTHAREYRLSELGDSELARTLFACAEFCQRAIRYLEAGRAEDALLYATICLEFLFSERDAVAESVCSRGAVVNYLRLASSFPAAEDELRKLYRLRSDFVHSGRPVQASDAERVIAYARETLRCLLVLHFKEENRSEGFIQRWIKNLDFLVAGLRAGRTFDDSFLAESGVFGW